MNNSTPIHLYTSDMAGVHHIYSSSLASAPSLIASTYGDDGRRSLIGSYYSNVLASLEAHHGGEEQHLFPLLIERAPEARQKVELGATQHHDVVALLTIARAAVAEWESKGDSEAGNVVSALGALNTALVPHLDYEEATIVPLAIEHVSMDEWVMVPRYAREHFKGDKFWLIMGLAWETLTDEERAMRLGQLPPDLRQWWETFGEPSFNDMISEVRQAG